MNIHISVEVFLVTNQNVVDLREKGFTEKNLEIHPLETLNIRGRLYLTLRSFALKSWE